MRWMGWSWEDYQRTPVSVLAVAVELYLEEQQALANG